MHVRSISVVVAALALFGGCATEQKRGTAYGREQEFRRQIEESVLVKEWGYKVQDIRFSDDYRKALVVFVTPGKTSKDVVLAEDDFHRYTGNVLDNDRQITTKSRDPSDWATYIRITLPDR